MSLPIVAIVGRPNVGKSSLLNCLVGRRISIVDATPGVTRDRISAPVPLGEGYVELTDTGGVGIKDVDDLTEDVTAQIEHAVAAAALILFVVDAREGVTPLDRQVAEMLRHAKAPALLVANKVDTPSAQVETGELTALGFGEPLEVSATHRLGRAELLEAIAGRLGEAVGEKVDEPVMKIAIVGRRNVGKSSFINALAGSERVIVSETPGTTRDSVDVDFELDGRHFVAIDTAGVRKRSRLAGDIEFYSRHRALRSIRRADVVLLLLEATEPVGRVDKELAAYVAELFKPVILVVNKWDLAKEGARKEDYEPYFNEMLTELPYAPISFTRADAGEGVRETVALAGELFAQSRLRVGTGRLNAAMEEILARHAPPAGPGGRPGKLFYTTQITVAPPTLVCFVNDVACFDRTYQRYMLNQLRSRLGYSEVPIRLLFRPRRREEGGGARGKTFQRQPQRHRGHREKKKE